MAIARQRPRDGQDRLWGGRSLVIRDKVRERCVAFYKRMTSSGVEFIHFTSTVLSGFRFISSLFTLTSFSFPRLLLCCHLLSSTWRNSNTSKVEVTTSAGTRASGPLLCYPLFLFLPVPYSSIVYHTDVEHHSACGTQSPLPPPHSLCDQPREPLESPSVPNCFSR